jgi:hypothetical protein
MMPQAADIRYCWFSPLMLSYALLTYFSVIRRFDVISLPAIYAIMLPLLAFFAAIACRY